MSAGTVPTISSRTPSDMRRKTELNINLLLFWLNNVLFYIRFHLFPQYYCTFVLLLRWSLFSALLKRGCAGCFARQRCPTLETGNNNPDELFLSANVGLLLFCLDVPLTARAPLLFCFQHDSLLCDVVSRTLPSARLQEIDTPNHDKSSHFFTFRRKTERRSYPKYLQLSFYQRCLRDHPN